MKMLKSLWNYRGFIFGSIKRDFQFKYRNSLFGVVWTFLSPLAMIVVYLLVFSHLMKAKLPGVDGAASYGIYLCAGTLVWGLFSEITQRMLACFLDNANLLKKLIFPRLCLPVVVLGNALINFSIIFSIFIVFLLVTDNFPGFIFFAIIPLMVILLMMSIGLGVTLGVLNVFFRDIGLFFGIFLQFWFWLTPIVYPASILPEKVQSFMKLNPLAAIIGGFQNIFVMKSIPDWNDLLYPLILSVILCYLGLYLFRRHSGDMVDEL